MLWTHRLAVFLSAALLFQMELIAAKIVLPIFGGGYLVWGACLVFFQFTLLLGYLYAAWGGKRLAPKTQHLVNLALFAVALVGFPLNEASLGTYTPGQNPFFVIALGLAAFVGVPFLVLSAQSVVAQRLLAAADRPEARDPYVLYAWSNVGSFVGLLGYPFLVEPLFDVSEQLLFWRMGFGLTALCFAALGLWLPKRAKDTTAKDLAAKAAPSALPAPPAQLETRVKLGVCLLGAAGSAYFLAATNIITMDVAAMPLLWTLPLSIFLFTFVLVFKKKPWLSKSPGVADEGLTLIVVVSLFLFQLHNLSYRLPVWLSLLAHFAAVFGFCLEVNRRVAENKPADARVLGDYFLFLSLGGFLGSTLVTWIAPLVATQPAEHPFSLILGLAGFAVLGATGGLDKRFPFRAAGLIALVLVWPRAAAFVGDKLSGVVAAAAGAVLAVLFWRLEKKPLQAALLVGLCIVVARFADPVGVGQTLLHTERNFYGVYKVHEKDGMRFLRHGTTLHGRQSLDPEKRGQALTYYHMHAPAGEFLAANPLDAKRVGVVGLGAGSLAAYGKPGQKLDFLELDPDNEGIARRFFTYLEDSKAQVRVEPGDARLTLRTKTDRFYDVLVVDAFNSDSIPIHLLTTEAFAEYRQKTADRGIVLLHASNNYFELSSVIYAGARAAGLDCLVKTNIGDVAPGAEASLWVALTWSPAVKNLMTREFKWIDVSLVGPPRVVRPWTDRYANPISALVF